jgi:hypothetical protein
LGKEEWKYLSFIHLPHLSKHASTDNISSGLENSSDNIIDFICQKDGIQILNYLDDLTGCEEERYSNFAFDFLGECVKQSRNFFISRLLIWLREISDKGSFCIPLDLKLDLLWWNKCLPLYNGVSIMLSEEFSSPDEILSVDACLLRCGGWMNDRYFQI